MKFLLAFLLPFVNPPQSSFSKGGDFKSPFGPPFSKGENAGGYQRGKI